MRVKLLKSIRKCLREPSLFELAQRNYLRYGVSRDQAYAYACNDMDHWFGAKDDCSISLIRF